MTTRIDEIADDIFRISTAVPPERIPGGFTFNQFLIRDEQPLLYHTGLRGIFPAVRSALETVLPVADLRYLAFSHFESDECGALNLLLDCAPRAVPLCGELAAMVSVDDFATRPARGLRDGEEVELGRHRVRWVDTPHLPHAWECGHLHDVTTGTMFCGDLFTQGGAEHPPVTEEDILGPSEEARSALDYYAHSRHTAPLLEKLADLRPTTLACMHGASWRGDGASLVRALADSLARSP